MTSSFKIPKTKQLAGSDLSHMGMQSPLSRLETSSPDLMFGSIDVKTDRRHSGNTFGSSSNKQSTQCKPFFKNVVRNLLGLNSVNRGASTANHRAAGGLSQRAESSACFSNGWRPKRASDRLLPPDVTSEPLSPPQKKKTSPPSAKCISVESLDSLAELRSVEHAGSLSSVRCAPVEAKQQQKNSSAPGSDQTSEDHFVPPSRIKNKPSTGKSCTRGVSRPSSMHNGRGWLAASGNLRDDLREKDRQRWREFKEKKTSYRSAVLHHWPSKPKQTTSEPIVLSSEEEDEDEGDGGKCEISSRVEESRNTEHIEGQQASSSKVRTDKNSAEPPSFLQLEFILLHAGLTQAEGNGKMLITENGISIPLKGTVEGEVIVVASQIQAYGVWDGGVAQGGSLFAGCKGPAPSLLFLWVTDAQATLLQMELTAIQTSVTPSGLSCSFILLVLKEQLQELQAALLASIMDTEEYRKGYSSCSGPASPLEWTDGLLLLHSCPPPLDQHLLALLGCTGEKMRNNQRKGTSSDPQHLQQLPTRLIQYPAPPSKGRITVTKEDLACLDVGKFLNDVIIDFYLKYLFLEGVGGHVTERSHVFSSFFYKQLSRRRAAGENDAPSVLDRHMRHQRVKTWTRHVDIFTKDFLFVPVNQESHWFLIVVCFPGLEDVRYEAFRCPTGGSERAAGNTLFTPRSLQTPECLQQGCVRDSVLKRPCILVMDSLKLSYHENVCRLLRDYLQVEWEVRRGTPRLFTSDKMRSYNCRVPQQDNSSDCGLYLLQYAESFLQNPVVHFALQVRLDNWFPRQQVRRKREEIRSLIMRMHHSQKKIAKPSGPKANV